MCMTVQGVGNSGSKYRMTSAIRTGSSKSDVHDGGMGKQCGARQRFVAFFRSSQSGVGGNVREAICGRRQVGVQYC